MVLCCAMPFLGFANDKNPTANSIPADTARIIDLEETVIVASPKETTKLRRQPLSARLFDRPTLKAEGINSVKDLTGHIPNFFLPDYGSRLTSSIYIRGIGSRMNTPAVGLYVDNLPATNTSAYDISFLDIERIDVLSGPQGTLYGRNAMGGLIRIFTSNPMQKQGTRISVGGSLRNAGRHAAFSTAHKINDKWAFAIGVFYNGQNGFFRNDSTHRKTDQSNAGGGKLRLVFEPSKSLKFDWNTKYEYSDQGGYSYRYVGASSGTEEQYPEGRGLISANRQSSYRRSLFSSAFNATLKNDNYILTSVTGYQHLDDRMFMDQDFIAKDIYTLEQKQQESNWSEELTLRNRKNSKWSRSTGVFALLRSLNTQAPVTFHDDGMAMLNNTLSGYMPTITMTNPMSDRPMSMNMSLKLTDPSIYIGGRFRTPMQNYALFHQSEFKNILPRVSMTIGLRLDYEHQSLSYRSGGQSIAASYAMSMIPTYDFTVSPLLRGNLHDDYWQLLPKVGFTYRLPGSKGNLYAVFSKGYRSGGYNIQMCSDLYQLELQKDLLGSIHSHVDNILQEQIDNARTETLQQMFSEIKKTVDESMPTGTSPDTKAIRYKPEYNWNYEVGAHLKPAEMLQIDMAAFLMSIHNQQISRFAPGGMGRQMVNAGRSRSMGIEISARGALLENRLKLSAGYGYTRSKFRSYDDGRNNYKGNYVPFVPMHNLSASSEYIQPIGKTLKSLTVGINTTALGRIYWTERNDKYQDFYALLNAHVKADFGFMNVNLWGKNLTGTKYHTFYFESMSRGFAQDGVPAYAGIDIDFAF